MVDENINSIMIMTLKEKTFFIAVSKRRVTGCSTDPEYHFPNINYIMRGYNILVGYLCQRREILDSIAKYLKQTMKEM